MAKTVWIVLHCIYLFVIPLLSSFNMGWINYTFSSGIYCSSLNGICSHISHFVFWIQPENPLINYIGGGYINFNNNTSLWQSSSKIDFEQHYFSFNQSMRAQVYNFMYESFFTLDMINQYNISCINVKLFLNGYNNQQIQYLTLPNCLQLNEINLNIQPNTEQLSYYDHGNSTIECYMKQNQCRLVVHVVFKYAPKGDFINNYNYIGNGELYINNNGTMPTNLTGNMDVIWEKAMIYQNNTWYHGSNWGFDHIGDYQYLSKNIKFVCWKVFVMDLQQSGNIYYIPMDGGYGGYQISKYVRCFEPTVHFWD